MQDEFDFVLPVFSGLPENLFEEMDATIDNLNDSQLESLKQFKKNIADVLPPDLSDTWLIKWLRSNSYNLRKTEALFRGALKSKELYLWKVGVENYVKPEPLSKFEFSCSLGIAKNGSPIRYTRLGAADYMGLLMSLSGYQISYYCNYLIEYDLAVLKKENERSGRNVAEITYVVDMEGFSIQTMMYRGAFEMGLDLLQVMQDQFPEVWGHILIINAPGYFDKFFNIFKPILKLNMLRKIRVTSRDSSSTLLLRYIDEDVLPVFLGGKRVDSFGNPRCTEFVKFGGKISPELYLRNRPRLLETDPMVTSLWVSARSVYNHSVVVRKKNSYITVEFRSENGSIGLKMLFRPFDSIDPEHLDLPPCDEYLDNSNPSNNVMYVSPFLRVQAHHSPVDEKIKAPWPGIYIFRFDNTNSWFVSKKIIFRIRLLKNEI